VKRYFFDFVNDRQTLHDFEGQEFLTARAACEQANLLAIDLHIDCDSEWVGWQVAVRDALGHLLHSIPVPAPELH
jgi:hypothetical protein